MQKFLIFLTLATVSFASHAARVGDKNIGWPGTTLGGTDCYGRSQGFGPFDYAVADAARRGGYSYNPSALVEGAHFTPQVEQLIAGKTGHDPRNDIDYTLRAFPNHHRALWSMSRYYLRQLREVGYEKLRRAERPRQGTPPPECYFYRAMAFAAEDAMVPAIYGIYLHRRGELDAALASYSKAEEQIPEHAELMYNIGLLQLDMNNIEKAKEYADRAQQLGYPLTGLQRKIQKMEQREPGKED